MKNKILLGVLFLTAIISFSFLFTKNSNASRVEFKVNISSEKVKKGEEIPVTVTVTGSALIKSVDAYVNYDETMLEFVGAEGDCITGSSGVLRIADNYEDGGVDTAIYHMTFQALEIGSTTIHVQETYVEEENNHQVNTVSNASVSVQITKNTEESKDATLKILEVYPEGVTPVFSSDITSYSLDVEKNVTELIISAIPADEDSVVTLEGNDKLSDGANEVVITVTSLSGEKTEYKITVNR